MTQDPDPAAPAEEPTVSLASDPPTVTGPAVDSWPLDDLLRGPVADQRPVPPPRPAPAPAQRPPVYYVALTVAVMLVLGLVAGLTVLSLNPPVIRVGGAPGGVPIPDLPAPTSSAPPGTPTTTPVPPPPDAGAYAELAAHPLSDATATMPELTCALPTFDPADAAQAEFYAAAKVCADGAFGGLLTAAGLPAVPVEVVTVLDGPVETPCGAVAPADPARQCAGTVYMTPEHLRDGEANDRYPGRYLGVFLREYARAVQEGTGLTGLYEGARAAGATDEDLVPRADRQAVCLAGIAAGAMAGRGAVDDNITTEIRERLTDRDAPADGGVWLDRGFQARQPSACNAWA